MSDEDIGTKLIRTIPFDRKKDSFRMWSKIFESKIKLQGHAEILKEDTEIPEQNATHMTEKQTKTFKSNSIVYSELMFSISDDV